MADFPAGARHEAVGFSIGTKGYIGTGYDGSSTYYNDFWEYNSSLGTWIQKANLTGGAREGAVGFSIGSKGYIGTGRGTTGFKMDLWEYDTTADSWTQKANFPGAARDDGFGFSIGTKGYIGTGQNSSLSFDDFYEYDPGTDTWAQCPNFPGGTRAYATGFSIGAKGYAGMGYNGMNNIDFWEYSPSTLSIHESIVEYSISIYPNPFSNVTTLRSNDNLKHATLTIYDLYGQIVKQIKNIRRQTIVLSRDDLPSGLYFLG